MDFSGFKHNGDEKKKKNGRIVNIKNNQTPFNPESKHIIFVERLLFYINEKNISFALNADKKILPHFLLLNEDAKENIQFFIAYDEERKNKVLREKK